MAKNAIRIGTNGCIPGGPRVWLLGTVLCLLSAGGCKSATVDSQNPGGQSGGPGGGAGSGEGGSSVVSSGGCIICEPAGGSGGGGSGGSSSTQASPRDCGNGTKEAGEGCDDGNTDNNDGCNRFCQIRIRLAL